MPSSLLSRLQQRRMIGELWVPQEREAGHAGQHLSKKFKPLAAELYSKDSQPRDVSPGPRETGHESLADWVRADGEDGRNLARGVFGSDGRGRIGGHDSVDLQVHQSGRGSSQIPSLALRPAILENEVFPFLVSEVAQPLQQRWESKRPLPWGRAEHPDPGNLPGLLRFYGERRGEEAAGQGTDE